MNPYYVSINAQSNGDHEVHVPDCRFFPQEENRIYLGYFSSSRTALRAARKFFDHINGCYHCVKTCHQPRAF